MERKKIEEYLSDNLNHAEKEALEIEILNSKKNLEIYTSIKTEQVSAALRSINYKANEDIEFGKLQGHIKRKQRTFFLKVASVFIVFLTLGVSVYYATKSHETLYAFEDENKVIVLEDGSSVTLNEASTLLVHDFKDQPLRNVLLKGEAFFDVTKNLSKPFRIQLDNNLSVKVLGTSFRLKSFTEDDEVITTLFTGKVQLQEKDKVLTELLPNQQIIYNKISKQYTVRNIEDTETLNFWKNNWMIFESVSLENLAKELERRYQVKIKMEVDNAEALEFTGKFKREVQIKEVLEVLKLSLGIDYEIQKNIIKLY